MPDNVTTEDSTGADTLNAGKTYTEAELQAVVEKAVKDRLERQKRSLEAQRQKEQEEAEARKLADQQEYKTLAEKHEARVKELEPVAERVKRYADTLDELLKVEMKAVPDYVKELLADKDPVDALGWIAKHRSDFTTPNAPNINGSDRGAAPSKDERVKTNIDSLKMRGGYGGF